MDTIIGSMGYANFIVVLCVLVFVHELGHYAVARWCGVRVEIFSIGFGREIFGWTDRHGTRWKISILPLGGYVKMFGEHSVPTLEDDRPREMTPAEKAVSFSHKTLLQRTAVVAAGPGANFLFAIVALMIVFIAVGKPEAPEFREAGIGAVVEGSAAADAGLMAGDVILSIDGQPIEVFTDLQRAVVESGGRTLEFKIQRDGARLDVPIAPRPIGGEGEQAAGYRLGVQAPMAEYVQFGLVGAGVEATKETWRITTTTLAAVGEMIVGQRGTEELGGPVRIVQLSNDFAQLGFLSLVGFTVLLSVNLGLINLFPVPMLDGGHLLYYAIEAIRGKPLGERAQEYGLRIGMAFIVALMIFVTVNDFIHLPL